MADKRPLMCSGTPLAPAGHERLDNGVATKRFRKDLITEGVYRHPKEGWTLDTTPERMARWVKAFRAMTAAGIKVPLPAGHSYDPRDGQGFAVEMSVEKNAAGKSVLFGVLEFVGDDAISLAYRTQQVSISINPDFTDGTGRHFGEVIEHVALTGYPVVPGQQDFKAIAASLVLADEDTNTKETHMTPEQLAKLKELLGLTEDLTAENFMDVLAAKIKEMAAAAADLKTKLDEAATAAEDATPPVDPELIDDRAESADEQIDSLVDTGKVVPAVAAALKLALVGEKGKRLAFCLSRRLSQTPESIAKGVINALKLNDPVTLGEQTRSQAMALSRQTPGEDETKADAAEIKRRAESVSSGK